MKKVYLETFGCQMNVSDSERISTTLGTTRTPPRCSARFSLPQPPRTRPSRTTGYAITTWTEKEGLPAGRIRTIAQGFEGYLWLGLETGLVRFDGVRFVPWAGAPLRRAPARARASFSARASLRRQLGADSPLATGR